MSDQSIPKSQPATQQGTQLPTEWQLFFKELLKRVSELERRVTELETP